MLIVGFLPERLKSTVPPTCVREMLARIPEPNVSFLLPLPLPPSRSTAEAPRAMVSVPTVSVEVVLPLSVYWNVPPARVTPIVSAMRMLL